MAHEIELRDGQHNFAYAGKKAWHGLGEKVDPTAGLDIWMQQAGVDWAVRLEPAYYMDKAGNMRPSNKGKILVREDDDKVLSHVGPRYKPTQNRDLFGFLEEYLDADYAVMDAMGSLNEGREVFALANFNRSIILPGDDRIDTYLMILCSHRPGLAHRVMPTDVRVVCNNTKTWAISRDGQRGLRFMHNETYDSERLNAIKLDMGITVGQIEMRAAMYGKMTEVQVGESWAADYFRKVVGDTERPLSDQPGAYTLCRDLFEGKGMGSDLASARGTIWGAYNAVTEYIDHYRGNNRAQRLSSTLIGTGANVKQQAFELAAQDTDILLAA